MLTEGTRAITYDYKFNDLDDEVIPELIKYHKNVVELAEKAIELETNYDIKY